MTCPDDETFAAFTEGSLASAERAAVADHAAGCEACHAVISSLVTDPATASARRESGKNPTTI